MCVLEEAVCFFEGIYFKLLMMDFVDRQFLSVQVYITCLSTPSTGNLLYFLDRQ